jgi:flagella basal body P-ring formation protein FlgA
MTINHFAIKRLTTLPRDFANYKSRAIYISKASLKSSHGTFYVEYINDTKVRKIFYKYQLDAKIALYLANHDLKRGDILDISDVEYKEINFDRIRYEPIDKSYLYGNYLLKRDINQEEIITRKDLKIKPDIKRGQTLDASLYSEGLVVHFSVKAMQNGRIGDLIRVSKDHKKIFKAKIISSSRVEIIY